MRILLCTWLILPLTLFGQNPQADQYALIGAQRLMNKSYQEAIIALNKSIQLNPNNWVAYEFRAQAYFHMDDKTSAIKDLDKAIQLSVTNSELYYKRGILNELLKLYDEAESDYRSAIRFNGGAYEEVEARLAGIMDSFTEDVGEPEESTVRGAVSYAPNHFSPDPYRYNSDRIQIQNRDYYRTRTTYLSPEEREAPTMASTPVESLEIQSARATPFSSATYDPYENDDKSFGDREDINRVAVRGGRGQGISKRNSLNGERFEARVASPNKRVFIDEIIKKNEFTEVKFRIEGNSRSITLPPDKIRLIVNGRSYYLHGSYKQAAMEYPLQAGNPVNVTLRFEPIPEKTDYIRVISRGERSIEKWDFAYRLYPK